jgi:flagellar motor component MotA
MFGAVTALALWSAIKLFRPGASPDRQTKAWLDAILFWGGFAVICGVLGTLIGIIVAAQAIEAVGDVSTPLVWGGIKVALLTSVFGILILAFAALLWFVLQLRWRLLEPTPAP